MSVTLRSNFLTIARCLIFEDTATIAWTFNTNTNMLTANGPAPAVGSVAGTAGQIVATTVAGVVTISIDAAYVGQTSITTLGTVATGVWNGTAVDAAHGGTGQTVYAVGDLLYASTTTALSRLADVATGKYLASGGVGVAPVWTTFPSIPAAPVGANPTAVVGLTAVNGSATTFLRSDGAPPLNQAISPTMTGNWTFTPTSGQAPIINGAGNLLQLNTSAARGNGSAFLQISDPTGIKGAFGYESASNDNLYVLNAMAAALILYTNGANRVSISSSGAVQFNSYGAGIITSDASGNLTAVAAAAIPVGANPSASVGLSAVVGSATTFMRSDAAPPLNQAISPTMTGNWVFTPAAGTGIVVNGVANSFAAQLLASTTSGQSFGLSIHGGTTSGDYGFKISNASNALDFFIVKGNGIIQMPNYGAGAATFDASGNISSVSDERMKSNIRPFRRGLDDVLKLRPILHGYKAESGLDQTKDDYAGFSAQNVQSVIPEAVGQNADGTLSLSDRGILAALVNAVKELSTRLGDGR